MKDKNPFHAALNEAYETLHLLYYSVNMETKQTLLKRLEKQIGQLAQACEETNSPGSRLISRSELARSNGRNGNPAYVAVNGVVYDVTNAPGWAAATHFGLQAGQELTEEFISCHGNADLLSRLKAIGRLADDNM